MLDFHRDETYNSGNMVAAQTGITESQKLMLLAKIRQCMTPSQARLDVGIKLIDMVKATCYKEGLFLEIENAISTR